MRWEVEKCYHCETEIEKHEEYYQAPDGAVCKGCIDTILEEHMEYLKQEWKFINEPDYDLIMDDMRLQEED